MDLGLAGQTALVTGGGRGIGKGIALALAHEGVHVAIASRDPDPATIAQLEALGVRAKAIPTDVSSEEQVDRMVATTIERFGHLDLFVSNAGAHWHEPVTRLDARERAAHDRHEPLRGDVGMPGRGSSHGRARPRQHAPGRVRRSRSTPATRRAHTGSRRWRSAPSPRRWRLSWGPTASVSTSSRLG